jgi:hypothetical protein
MLLSVKVDNAWEMRSRRPGVYRSGGGTAMRVRGEGVGGTGCTTVHLCSRYAQLL